MCLGSHKNGSFVPMHVTTNNKQEENFFSLLTAKESRKAHYYVKARNIIISTLILNEHDNPLWKVERT